jgi:hypothetical protein
MREMREMRDKREKRRTGDFVTWRRCGSGRLVMRA